MTRACCSATELGGIPILPSPPNSPNTTAYTSKHRMLSHSNYLTMYQCITYTRYPEYVPQDIQYMFPNGKIHNNMAHTHTHARVQQIRPRVVDCFIKTNAVRSFLS